MREIAKVAFDGLRLHRIEASTQLPNLGSRRVLERCGFTRIGVAPKYLRVDGDWKDVALYQLVNPR